MLSVLNTTDAPSCNRQGAAFSRGSILRELPFHPERDGLTSALVIRFGHSRRKVRYEVSEVPSAQAYGRPEVPAAGTAGIEDLMCELKKRRTIVIVTHHMQQAARVSVKTSSG